MREFSSSQKIVHLKLISESSLLCSQNAYTQGESLKMREFFLYSLITNCPHQLKAPKK